MPKVSLTNGQEVDVTEREMTDLRRWGLVKGQEKEKGQYPSTETENKKAPAKESGK